MTNFVSFNNDEYKVIFELKRLFLRFHYLILYLMQNYKSRSRYLVSRLAYVIQFIHKYLSKYFNNPIGSKIVKNTKQCTTLTLLQAFLKITLICT